MMVEGDVVDLVVSVVLFMDNWDLVVVKCMVVVGDCILIGVWVGWWRFCCVGICGCFIVVVSIFLMMVIGIDLMVCVMCWLCCFVGCVFVVCYFMWSRFGWVVCCIFLLLVFIICGMLIFVSMKWLVCCCR